MIDARSLLKNLGSKILKWLEFAIFRITNSFGWQTLRDIQNHKIITSMYIWLIIVPISAKFLYYVKEDHTLKIFGSYFKFDFGLPFSWQALFFCAVFFVIGNTIHRVFSPSLVRDHKNYKDFVDSGKGQRQLFEYMDEFSEETQEDVTRLRKLARIKDSENEHGLRENFWDLYVNFCYCKPVVRFICTIAYLLGFLFLADVAYKNLMWVVSNTNFVSFKNELFFGGVIDWLREAF